MSISAEHTPEATNTLAAVAMVTPAAVTDIPAAATRTAATTNSAYFFFAPLFRFSEKNGSTLASNRCLMWFMWSPS